MTTLSKIGKSRCFVKQQLLEEQACLCNSRTLCTRDDRRAKLHSWGK